MRARMGDQHSIQDRELMRRWVETWRRAGPELDEIRRKLQEVWRRIEPDFGHILSLGLCSLLGRSQIVSLRKVGPGI